MKEIRKKITQTKQFTASTTKAHIVWLALRWYDAFLRLCSIPLRRSSGACFMASTHTCLVCVVSVNARWKTAFTLRCQHPPSAIDFFVIFRSPCAFQGRGALVASPSPPLLFSTTIARLTPTEHRHRVCVRGFIGCHRMLFVVDYLGGGLVNCCHTTTIKNIGNTTAPPPVSNVTWEERMPYRIMYRESVAEVCVCVRACVRGD